MTVRIINAPRSLRGKYPTRTIRTCHSDTCGCLSHEGSFEETELPIAVANRLTRVPGNPHEHARHVWTSSVTRCKPARGEWAAAQVETFLQTTTHLSTTEQGQFVSAFVAAVEREQYATFALPILADGYNLSNRRAELAQQRTEQARQQFSSGFCNPLAAALVKAGLA